MFDEILLLINSAMIDCQPISHAELILRTSFEMHVPIILQ